MTKTTKEKTYTQSEVDDLNNTIKVLEQSRRLDILKKEHYRILEQLRQDIEGLIIINWGVYNLNRDLLIKDIKEIFAKYIKEN